MTAENLQTAISAAFATAKGQDARLKVAGLIGAFAFELIATDDNAEHGNRLAALVREWRETGSDPVFSAMVTAAFKRPVSRPMR